MTGLGQLVITLGIAAWIVTILLALIPERPLPPLDLPRRTHVDTSPRPYDWQRETGSTRPGPHE